MSEMKYSNWKILKQFQDIIKFLFRKIWCAQADRVLTVSITYKNSWQVLGIISTRPVEMVLGGLHHEFYWYILILLWSNPVDFQKPFFVLETGNVFTWLTVIHYNSCLLGRLFSMWNCYISDETVHLKGCFTAMLMLMETSCPRHSRPSEVPFF